MSKESKLTSRKVPQDILLTTRIGTGTSKMPHRRANITYVCVAYVSVCVCVFFPWLDSPSELRTPHCWGFEITLRHTTLGRTPLDKWSARRRHLPDNKQHSQEIDTHALGGVRTYKPSKRAAEDPRPKPCGYCDLLPTYTYVQGDTKKRELLKCVVAAMYSWQHCGTGTLSYRQPRNLVIMDQWKGQQRAFAIKMF